MILSGGAVGREGRKVRGQGWGDNDVTDTFTRFIVVCRVCIVGGVSSLRAILSGFSGGCRGLIGISDFRAIKGRILRLVFRFRFNYPIQMKIRQKSN